MPRTINKLRLGEISGVDRPAQVGARSIIMKRDAGDPEITRLLDNARAIEVQGPTVGAFTSKQFEAGMLALAEAEAVKNGTTPEYALANGWTLPSSDLQLLGKAWNAMQMVEYHVAKRY